MKNLYILNNESEKVIINGEPARISAIIHQGRAILDIQSASNLRGARKKRSEVKVAEERDNSRRQSEFYIETRRNPHFREDFALMPIPFNNVNGKVVDILPKD